MSNKCYNMNDKEVFTPKFSSSSDEIEYLRNKVGFLLKISREFADSEYFINEKLIDGALYELQNIKNSRSWIITKPLRDYNKFVKFTHKTLMKKIRRWVSFAKYLPRLVTRHG